MCSKLCIQTVLIVCWLLLLRPCNGITVTIDATNKTGPSIPDEYISVTVGVLTNERANEFPFDSTEFNTLAKGLSPAYMRFGGTDADQLIYLMNGNMNSQFSLFSANNTHQLNLTLFKKIGDFAQTNNWKFVFGLNEQMRINTTNAWNSTNTKQLLSAIKNSNKQNNNNSYVFAFELGNEPNLYKTQTHQSEGYVIVSPEQEAKDFHTLYNLIQNEFNHSENDTYFVAELWGNDCDDNFNRNYQQQWSEYIHSMNITNEISAQTFHHYYGSGKTFNLSDYYSVNNLDSLIPILQNVTNISKQYFGPNKRIIIGETAASSSGGAENITDTFVSGFMWLDTVGLSSIYGIYAICRQTLFHSNYALINEDKNGNFIVTPDYWTSYLFKHLVANKVVFVHNQFDYKRYLRVYAFCTRTMAKNSVFDYKQGSITVMILNLYNTTQEFDMHIIGIDNNNIDDMSYDQFHLTPNQNIITSPQILSNGKIIKMINATTFPQLIPINSKFGSTIQISAMSYMFVVVSNTNCTVCV